MRVYLMIVLVQELYGSSDFEPGCARFQPGRVIWPTCILHPATPLRVAVMPLQQLACTPCVRLIQQTAIAGGRMRGGHGRERSDKNSACSMPGSGVGLV